LPATKPINTTTTSAEVAIIGAGLSGLAAAARLAMFGKRVILLEKHYVVGGLNSFYARKGRKFDVGLHALTNYPSPASGKSSPLLKLCRQLRISIDQLNLLQQSHSRITFGEQSLLFNNDFQFFISQVEEMFPSSIDAFFNLLKKMDEFPAYSVDAEELSTRSILKESGIDPLLGEMLLCPTCYYGSARADDIDFPTFIMLFDAIFRQGLSKPKAGIRAILDPLTLKLKELGVDRRMNSAVRSIQTKGNVAGEIILESGEIIRADKIISTCGIRETESMIQENCIGPDKTKTGQFSIIESIRVFKGHPKDFGWNETVVFFNRTDRFLYDCPKDLVDLESGVICLPDNYGTLPMSEESKLRVTHPANFHKWSELSDQKYLEEKEYWQKTLLKNALHYLPKGLKKQEELEQRTLLLDTFTPTTIKHFTSHINGTLYGSPTKTRDGSTRFNNLFLAGTDQGYVGIVGAMLGGIAVANNQILRKG